MEVCFIFADTAFLLGGEEGRWCNAMFIRAVSSGQEVGHLEQLNLTKMNCLRKYLGFRTFVSHNFYELIYFYVCF